MVKKSNINKITAKQLSARVADIIAVKGPKAKKNAKMYMAKENARRIIQSKGAERAAKAKAIVNKPRKTDHEILVDKLKAQGKPNVPKFNPDRVQRPELPRVDIRRLDEVRDVIRNVPNLPPELLERLQAVERLRERDKSFLRSMLKDVERIAENTKFTTEELEDIKDMIQEAGSKRMQKIIVNVFGGDRANIAEWYENIKKAERGDEKAIRRVEAKLTQMKKILEAEPDKLSFLDDKYVGDESDELSFLN